MLDKPISALADTVTKYNLDPGTCVSALFWQANRSRMPDGPFPNMVGSEKFLMTALTGYLNVPREAVLAAASVAAAKSRIEGDYNRACKAMAVWKSKLEDMHAIPAVYRFVYSDMDEDFATKVADFMLDELKENTNLSSWLEDKGWTFDDIEELKNGKS